MQSRNPETRPTVPAAYFINSDAISNGGISYHDKWMEEGVAVLSGGPAYLRKLGRPKRGDTLLLYVAGLGVVAAGRVVDDAPITVVGAPETISPREPVEYHRRIAWYADLRAGPIRPCEIAALRGSNPLHSLSELISGKAAILSLVDARAEKIDFDEISTRSDLSATEAEELRRARRGQGRYREELLNLWDWKCAVTGCDLDAVLRASHALPWKKSTDEQRLDPANGLPLVATIDALFDRGLIGFDDDGVMLCSPMVEERHRTLLGLPMPLRLPLTDDQKAFLAAHRRLYSLCLKHDALAK